MTDTCTVIATSSEKFDIETIIAKYAIFSHLYLITNNKQLPLTTQDYEITHLKNSNRLVELISTLLHEKFYLEAVPSSQIGQDIDGNRLIINNGKLTLYLNQATYVTVPSMSKFATVKKLAHTKVGHGSKNLVNYSYSISLNLTELQPELVHILNSQFNICHISSTLKIDSSESQTVLSCKKLHENMNLSPLLNDIEVINLDLAEFYEYLCLLNLNSSQLLTNNHIDDYLSMYQPPESSKSYDTQLFQHHITNIASTCLPQLLSNHWVVLSGYTSTGHLLLFKSPINDEIITWQVKN